VSPRERLILCGELASQSPDKKATRLLLGQEKVGDVNLTLDVLGVEASLARELPPRLEDLLVIAGYVLGADSAVDRGRPWEADQGRRWIRHFRLRVPVNDFEFWSQPAVVKQLESVLGLVSGEHFRFEFVPRRAGGGEQLRLFKSEGPSAAWRDLDTIMLFSGGMDSFGGAVDELLLSKRRVGFVSHESTEMVAGYQRNLVGKLRELAPHAAIPHASVRYRRSDELDAERSQRTRSFLFTALAAVVAGTCGHEGIRFYENGIVSLNLPLSEQVQGSKASRTTHPLVLRGYADLLTHVFERPFAVDNPYLFKTRAEVVDRIVAAGQAELIQATFSCAHPIEATVAQPHCGRCSQCVDRRFALEARGLRWEEDGFVYRHQVFEDPFEDPEARLFITAYITKADEWAAMRSPEDFVEEVGHAGRAILGVVDGAAGGAHEALKALQELHRRHGLDVQRVANEVVGRARQGLHSGDVHPLALPRLLTQPAPGAAPPEGAAAPALEPVPSRIFRRRGELWEVRFDGGATLHLKHTHGMDVICRLFARPGQRVSVFDLDSPDFLERIQTARKHLGPKADRKTAKAIEAQREHLEGRLHEAEEMTDVEAVIDIKRELGELSRYGRRNFKPGGRERLDDPLTTGARDRVRSAYKTAIRNIAEHSPVLAKFLDKHIEGIQTAHATYFHDGGDPWLLEVEKM
jgi:hypothetical protein